MALAGKHAFGAIEDQRVTFVEKKLKKIEKIFYKNFWSLMVLK